MRRVVGYIAKGRIQGIAAATILASVAPLFFPLYWPSGAIIGLFTLRYGASEGAVVLAGTAGVYLLLTAMLFKSAALGLGTLVSIWLPVFGLCCVLRTTRSQGVALTLAGIVAASCVVAFHVGVHDVTAWWRPRLDAFFQLIATELRVNPTSDLVVRREQFVDAFAPVMTGVIVTTILFSAVIMMALARWFHAILDNPGGFGTEFRALRLDRRFALATVVLALMAVFAKSWFSGMGVELLSVAMVLYFFQGLAVVHSVVAHTGAWVGWLGAMYVLWLLATPQITVIMVLVGILDAAIDVRTRFLNRGGSS